MAESDQSQEKTQDPTHRRIEKAKENGEVLSSKEMFVFSTSVVGLLLLAVTSFLFKPAIDQWATLFLFSHPEEVPVAKVANAWKGLKLVILTSAFFGIPTFFAVVVMQSMVGGGIAFSSQALGVKWSKLDPIKGLGRIFSVKGLVELLKSIAKVVLLTSLAVSFLWLILPNFVYLSSGELEPSLKYIYRTLLLFVLLIVLVLLVIGFADYLWSRYTWLQQLRMSHQDVKDEAKETEGNPEVKSKIRRLQMEASRKAAERANSIEAVKDATVVITNPTHFAVAVRYEPSENNAPIIVAMGEDILAQRVIEQAQIHSVSVVRSPVLARALFFTGSIGSEISEQLYSAVASILAYVYQLENGMEATLNEPEIPEDLNFDENGNKR